MPSAVRRALATPESSMADHLAGSLHWLEAQYMDENVMNKYEDAIAKSGAASSWPTDQSGSRLGTPKDNINQATTLISKPDPSRM
jgi:hypothetical protein